MSPKWLVRWEIDDEDSETPTEAAVRALLIHRDPESTATVFDVFDQEGSIHHVDLTDVTVLPDLPLPGETFKGGTVIASTWLRDEPPFLALLLLLRPAPPFYEVADLDWNSGWVVIDRNFYPNINPATEAYASHGGDY